MKKKLYLHIGTDKTGSTAIQEACTHLKRDLKDLGVAYVSSPRSSHFYLDEAIRNNRFDVIEKVVSEIEGSEFYKHVISFEGLYHTSGDKLDKLISLFSIFEIKVILYVRDRGDKIRSGLAQRMKFGPAKSNFELIKKVYKNKDFTSLFGEGELNYYKIARKWEGALLKFKVGGKVSVGFYDRKMLLGGDVVRDFFNKIDIADADADFLISKSKSNSAQGLINPSISPAAQDVVALCKLLTGNPDVYNAIYPIVVKADNKEKTKASRVPDSDIRFFEKNLKDSDQALMDNFTEGAWFKSEPQFFFEESDSEDLKKIIYRVLSEFEGVKECGALSSLDGYVKFIKRSVELLEDTEPSLCVALLDMALELRPSGPVLRKKRDELKNIIDRGVKPSNNENSPSFDAFKDIYFIKKTNKKRKVESCSLKFRFDFDLEKKVDVEFFSNKVFDGHEKLSPRAESSISYMKHVIHDRILSKSRIWKLKDEFPHLMGKLLEVDFHFGDGVDESKKTLAYDSLSGAGDVRLIPDNRYFSSCGFYESRVALESKHRSNGWDFKKDIAFWRGAATGKVFSGDYKTADNIMGLQRVRLCEISAANNEFLDASITNIVKYPDEAEKQKIEMLMVGKKLFSKRVGFSDFADYKYLVEIDGNVSPWSFLPKLMMGSCVLRVSSDRKQWYYDQLEEWVHYVPVKQDMSDLIEKIQWCKDNDDKAREIAENGQRFADSLSFDSQMNFAAEQLLSAARVVSE